MGKGALTILQARLTSRRFPRKVLATLGEESLLESCVKRLRTAEDIAPLVLAIPEGLDALGSSNAHTSDAQEDLRQEARRLSLTVVEGPEEDVLARFIGVCQRFRPTHVIRATADNPLVDPSAVRRVLADIRASGADYVAEEGLPVGTGVEAVKVDALWRAHEEAWRPKDREHVTLFIRRNTNRFHVRMIPCPDKMRNPTLRLTVDTREDLNRVARITDMLDQPASRIDVREVVTVSKNFRSAAQATVASTEAHCSRARMA